MNKYKKSLLILLLIFSVFIGLFSIINSRHTGFYSLDEIGHYNKMRSYYDSKSLPVMGAYTKSISYPGDETNARVPGGYFYTEYLTFYTLANASLLNSILIRAIIMLIILSIFLFWVFKKFGFTTFAIITSLTITNISFITVASKFYNPYSVFILSFLLMPILGEYISKEKSFISSILIFPVIALMAQAHIAVHFSMTIAMIIYLIIRWKKTKINILGFAIGVFISFLTYLPYLLFEIGNNFNNTSKLFSSQDALKSIHPPQIYSLLFFPTNEIGSKYIGGIKDIIAPIFSGNAVSIYSFIMYVLSIAFSIIAFVITIKCFVNKNKKEETTKTILLNEMFFFYITYIFTTFMSFMFIFKIGSGRPHYFYSMFAFAYIPIIYLIEYIKEHKQKYLTYIIIFLFLNIISISFYAYSRSETSDNNGWTSLLNHIDSIYNDAKGKPFTLDISEKAYKSGFESISTINENLRKEEYKYLKYIITLNDENIDTNKYTKPITIYSNNNKYKVIRARVNKAFGE